MSTPQLLAKVMTREVRAQRQPYLLPGRSAPWRKTELGGQRGG